jgi:hypothetical protein
VPIGELGGGEQADEKSGFVSLIWRSKWSMNQSQRRAGERVGMLWSGAADHTTHRKSLPCSLLRHVTFLPLVKTYIARYPVGAAVVANCWAGTGLPQLASTGKPYLCHYVFRSPGQYRPGAGKPAWQTIAVPSWHHHGIFINFGFSFSLDYDGKKSGYFLSFFAFIIFSHSFLRA